MLRQIRLRNFVKFNGNHEHRLDFPVNGVYIFLGENNTGKSCVFEGIRRCMQTELNASISARHNPEDMSHVICLFEKANGDLLTSCFVSFKEDDDTIFCKIVFYKDVNGSIIVCSIRHKEEGRWGAFYKCILSNDTDEFHLLGSKLLNVNNEEEIASTEFINILKTLISDNNAVDDFDQSFQQIEFETVFAYRGINPIQTSRQIPIKEVDDRYKSANDLAFVIKTHLKELRDVSEVRDSDNESEYFNFMTEPESYTFELKNEADNKENTQIVVSSKNATEFSILKAPEGILEAKLLSITLSKMDTKTLLIEEPGRGMHPSMIDCLRDLVLYDVNKSQTKTVIFTTHNERFICPWTFEKIFYFYACENGSSEVVTLGHAHEKVTKVVDIKPYLWREQVTPIFFSKRVIMVEGQDDHRFLGAFKNILLTDEARRSSVCKGCKGDKDPDIDKKLRKFLTSLHIINMGGKSSVSGIEPLCKALNLPERKRRYYLFDSDALKSIKSFIMRTDLVKSDIEDQQLEKLEENGIFVWFAYTNKIVENFEKSSDLDVHLKRYGRLEEAIVEFSNTHDEKHHEKIKDCTVHNCMGMNTMLKSIGIDVSDKRNPQKKKPFELNNINYVEMREITTRIIDISMLYGDNCFYEKTNFECPFKRLFQFLINQAKRP